MSTPTETVANLLTGKIFDLLHFDGVGNVVDSDDADDDGEWVFLGKTTFEITGPDEHEMAVAAGLKEPCEPRIALRVRYVPAADTIAPKLADVIVVEAGASTGDGGPTGLAFLVGWTHAEMIAAESVADEGAIRNEALFDMRPGEFLLVQQFVGTDLEITA